MCKYLLAVEKANFHPGGTALRGEAMTPGDPIRWVMSGGCPTTVARTCSGNCPLKVPAEVGGYGASWTAPCAICRRANRLAAPGACKCKECGTEYQMVDRT